MVGTAEKAGGGIMSDCSQCKHAIWDSEEYYGTQENEWFVSGCRKGLEETEGKCEEFEEYESVDCL